MEWLKSQKGEKARKEGLGGPAFRPSPSNAVGAGLIPGRAAKTPHAWCPKHGDIKHKSYRNKSNQDFKNGPHQKKKARKETAFPLDTSSLLL